MIKTSEESLCDLCLEISEELPTEERLEIELLDDGRFKVIHLRSDSWTFAGPMSADQARDYLQEYDARKRVKES